MSTTNFILLSQFPKIDLTSNALKHTAILLGKIEKIRNVHTHRRLLVFNCDISVVSIVRCFKILSFTIKLLSEHTSWTFPTFLFHLRLPSLSFTPDSCDNPLAPMSIHEAFRILTWSRDRFKILHPTFVFRTLYRIQIIYFYMYTA